MKTCNKKLKMLSALIALFVFTILLYLNPATNVQAATTLVTYTNPSGGVTTNNYYTVQVREPGGNWRNLVTYQTTIGGYRPTQASFVNFDCSGSVEFSVTYNYATVTKASLLPKSRGLTPTVNGNTMTFTISGPQKLVLEMNGDINKALHIFANPVEVNPPSSTDPNVIYLGPGVYNQSYNVPSGKTLYITGGAVVRGTVSLDNTVNAKVMGRGIIDHPLGRGFSADNCNGAVIDGILVNDYGYGDNGGCLVNVGNSSNVTINNVKGFAYQKWTDAIDVFTSTNTTINDCFMRSGDDCIAVYGPRQNGGRIYWGDVHGLNATNCLMMPDVAHPINIGSHGDPSAQGGGTEIEDVHFSNMEVIMHNTISPVLPTATFACGDGNLIHNITFTDFNIDDICAQSICNIATMKTVYNIEPGRGIDNVYFKNINFVGTYSGSQAVGYDSNRITKNITFENLVINEKLVLNASEANFNVREFTSNIQFVAPGTVVPSPTPLPVNTPINLAYQKLASADSSQSGNPASRGNDGFTTGSRWCANDGNTGHWWMVDLGSSMNITGGTQVMWEKSGKAYQYKIETSNDNTNWKLMVDKTANTTAAQTQNDQFYDTARYVKITVTGLPSGAWASFNEFRVFGNPCNLAFNKATFADSSQAGSPASSGSDSNVLTKWVANDGNTGHWWTVDLGSTKNITYGTQVSWSNIGLYQYKVETSQDNINWTLKADKTGNTITDQVQTDYFTGTARYVRITVTGMPSGMNAGFCDFKVFGDLTDLALNKNTSTDSTQSGNPASGGNDDSIATRWRANDSLTGHWWKVDLGSNMNITGGTQVMWETDGASNNYKIDVSSDNVNWTTVIDKGGNNCTAQVQSDYFNTSARYVRITVTGMPSGVNAGFLDFKVFGEAKLWEVVSQSSMVNLSSNFNGDSFSYDTNRRNGNYDGSGYSFSADLTNTAPVYNGIPFQLGSISDGSNNTVNCGGQTIAIPQGSFNKIWLLGAGSGGNQTGTFQINYTDGTSSTTNITMVDWCGSASDLVLAYTHRHSSTADDMAHPVNICAYPLVPTAGKTVASIQLPNKSSMHIFAITSVLTAPVSMVDLSSSFNGDGFSYDTNISNGNFDGLGYSYSADLVNSAPVYNGVPFQFGPMSDGSNNIVNCSGQSITLTQGTYSKIMFLGASSGGDKTGTFQINYTDGTSSTANITVVDWCGSTPDLVETFAHRHNANGDDLLHGSNICAYTLTPTTGKTVSSVTLPNNSSIHIVAVTVVP